MELLQTSDWSFLALGALASIACAVTAMWAFARALAARDNATAKLVPVVMLVELVALGVAPLLVWLAARDSSTRFGADSVVALFVAPSLRAIGPCALALALVNGLVIAFLRTPR